MARPKSYSSDSLTERALHQFWTFGYNATSIDDLVRVTGVSRHRIYGEFGSKRGLFLACFARYRAIIVDPAFTLVEQPGATMADINRYFEYQIGKAERGGLPGPGCFFANAATETAPHDAEILALVAAHNTRLEQGFAKALARSAARLPGNGDPGIDQMAGSLVVFANGLWVMSRVTSEADELRSTVAPYLKLLEEKISNDST